MLRTARLLTRGLTGQNIVASDFRVPKLATVNLAGFQVGPTQAYGKHLFTELSSTTSKPLWLHSHRRMDGQWYVLAPDKWPPVPAWRIRVLVTTTRSRAAGVDLPVLDLVDADGRARVLDRLGPNVIDPDCDLSNVQPAVAGRTEPIASALLDQRLVAGLGTIWVSEGLFHAGVSPRTPSADVADVADLLATTGAMMRTAAQTRRPRWSVYDRRGRACKRCGGRIARVVVSAERRQVFWCPGCQQG